MYFYELDMHEGSFGVLDLRVNFWTLVETTKCNNGPASSVLYPLVFLFYMYFVLLKH